jgi:hypothetical protein
MIFVSSISSAVHGNPQDNNNEGVKSKIPSKQKAAQRFQHIQEYGMMMQTIP